MLFATDSLMFRSLPAIRRALVRLIDEVPAMEVQLRQTARLGLLEKYRAVVGELAEADPAPVAAQALNEYWRETAKECLGALGEAADTRRRAALRGPYPSGGLYQSAFLDRLYAAAAAPRSAQNLVGFLGRLDPGTGLDPLLAYGVLEKMSAGRRAECAGLAAELAQTFGHRPADVVQHLHAAAARFGLQAQPRGPGTWPLFVLPAQAGPWRFGLALQGVWRHAYSLLHFDFLLLDRSGTATAGAGAFGPVGHASIGLDHFFPGYFAAYGVFRFDLEMRLNIYAAFATAQAVAGRLAAKLEGVNEADGGQCHACAM
jgi:hypothetical protein